MQSEVAKYPVTPEQLKQLRALLEKATPTDDQQVSRYDHGGGRVYTDDGETRKLIADFYSENDREAWIALRNLAPALLDRLDALLDLLRKCDKCMSGHMIGINCHGPRLDNETVMRLDAALAYPAEAGEAEQDGREGE